MVQAAQPITTVPPGIWSGAGAVNLVNGVSEFGIDNTGKVADNSTTINNALEAGAKGGFGIYIPGPGANVAAVVNIQNPIEMGNGASGTLSSYQGGSLVGCGFPGMAALADYMPTFPDGFCTVQWNGAAGGTMLNINGPLQGWELRNLCFNAVGAAHTAAYGIIASSAQYGTAENIYVVGCTGNGISDQCQGGTFAAARANSMHNSWRKIAVFIPNAGFGLQIGYSTTAINNTCYEQYDDVSLITDASGTATYAIEFYTCDNVCLRNVHIANVTKTNVVGITYNWNGSGWPANTDVVDIDFGGLSNGGGTAVSVLNGPMTVVNTIRNPATANGVTPNPQVEGLCWVAPGQPTGVITGSPFTFTTGSPWTNIYGVPVSIYLTGGTITGVSIGGSSLGTGAAALTGPWRVSVGQTITLTGSGTITADVIGE